MYCCRSGKRSGNLRRTIEVARKLSDTFDVTVLMGDAIPERIDFPDNIQITAGNRAVAEGACLKCHEPITRTMAPGHDAATGCVRCHGKIGHPR